MTTYTKLNLSESKSGRPVPIVHTLGAASGTPLHIARGDTAGHDEVYIYATNRAGADANVLFSIGPAANSISDEVRVTLAFRVAPQTIIPGWPMNDSTGVYGRCDSIGAIQVHGFVNRID